MKRIFVSYARHDSDRVYPIVDILESAKFDIWIDKDDIPVGERWPERIVQGIEAAEVFLIFVSPASLESNAVTNELTIAYEEKLSRGLQIIPVILTPSEFPDQARFQLTGIEWIDFSKNFHENLEQLIHILGAESLPKAYKKHLLKHLPGLYVTPELISPYEKTSKDVVVGKTISIDQIRDQRFMARNAVLAQVLEEFDLHLQKRANNLNPEIFTFWIYGRSGSGKSVLLLQIMQEIILRRNAQVIWLDDAIELIPTLLEKWATQQIDLGEPLFIFADDFNAPQGRDRIAFKAIARLLRNPYFSKVTWPVLITCSPPEYLEEFQKTGNDEYFQIKKWHIPSVSKIEQFSFLEWFTSRTNETANPSNAFEQDEGLILSLMLELRYGDIIEFARRFRERLDGSHLLEEMAQPLALNRIYIWAPISWLNELNPEQQDALSALNLDQDFSILNIDNLSGKYIRLTHPHLSDAIYKSIRPDKSGYQRANDLATAFEKAFESDDRLASRILFAIAQGGARISDDLNEKILAEKIVAHCEKFVEIVSRSHPIGLAYIWTNLARWASREEHINSLFAPISPLDKAITEMGTDHFSWGDLWLQLWACYPKNEKLAQSGWDWLKHRSHFDEISWYPVWQTLLIHSEVLPQDVTKSDLLQIGIMWLSNREDRKWWSRIWQKVLENSHDLPVSVSVSDLIQIGENWLKGRENSGQWSFVWQDILKYGQVFALNASVTEILEYSISWLDGREDQPQWAFVWQDILKYAKNVTPPINSAKLLDLGVNWLSERQSSNQWTFIWQTLVNNSKKLQSTASQAKLIKEGLLWVYANRNKKEWPIIYNDLAKLKYSKEFRSIVSVNESISLGVDWIEIHKYEDRAAQLVVYLRTDSR